LIPLPVTKKCKRLQKIVNFLEILNLKNDKPFNPIPTDIVTHFSCLRILHFSKTCPNYSFLCGF
jgi:hypothetical protein